MDNCFAFPTLGLRVPARAILLAIDDACLPVRHELCYYLSKPQVRPQAVLTPSRHDQAAPDHATAGFYGTVLYDQGKFRMWYNGCHVGRNPDWPPEVAAEAAAYEWDYYPGPLCYAESDDGLRWVKPDLGQLPFKGSRHNNALGLPNVFTYGATVIKDDDDPDPQRRYKLVYEYSLADGSGRPASLRTATSPDGLRWTVAEAPLPHIFMEQSSFYKHNGLYIVNTQAVWPSEGGGHCGRQGVAWISSDFDHWLEEAAGSFLLPEPPDPAQRGYGKLYQQAHLGVGAASFGNVLVGLYCIWHDNPVFGRIWGDFGLVVSKDGIAFREPVKGHVFLAAEDSPAPPVPGKSYPTVLCQANGILNVGEESRIYHGRWRNVDYRIKGTPLEDCYEEVALATLPRDRWGALGLPPGRAQGSVWSAPVTLPSAGCRVTLNVDGGSDARVEIGDERFHLLPAFSGHAAGTPEASAGLDCEVRWPAAELSALGGQTVRFRVLLAGQAEADPRLYAISLYAP